MIVARDESVLVSLLGGGAQVIPIDLVAVVPVELVPQLLDCSSPLFFLLVHSDMHPEIMVPDSVVDHLEGLALRQADRSVMGDGVPL